MDTGRWLYTIVGLLVALGVTVECEEIPYCDESNIEKECCGTTASNCSDFWKTDDDVTCTLQLTTTASSTATSISANETDTSNSTTSQPTTLASSTATSTSANETDQSNTTTTSTTDANSNSTTNTSTTSTSTTTTTPTPTIICVKKCPSGFQPDEKKQCIKTKDDGFPLIPVIVGVAGGIVAVVVVVVIVVCLRRKKNLRKKKKPEHTRMSEIISDRDPVHIEVPDINEDVLKVHEKTQYVNIAYTADLNVGIQRNHDKVLRYTKDPTFTPQNEEKNPNYENDAMVDWSKLNKEKKEIEELPPAPSPPEASSSTSPGSDEHYLAMDPSHPETPEWNPEEDYANYGVPAEDEAEEQEDYENTDFVHQHMRNHGEISENMRNTGEISENAEDEEDQEDYENTQQFKHKPVHIVNRGVPQKRTDLHKEESSEDSPYANFPVVRQQNDYHC